MNYPYIYIIASFLLSILINWILIKFSLNLGVRNLSKEEEIRWQSKKPSIGGLSFYISFLIIYSIIATVWTSSTILNNTQELSLLLSCTAAFIVGLIDDAKNTNPLLKLLGQIICGVIITSLGITIEISPNAIWNHLFTIFWTVFLMNSINMLDNMDGLTTLISIFILSALLIISGTSSSPYFLHIACIVSVLFGFLYFNFNPSVIYMGDSGSQFLGVLLAHLSITTIWGYRVEYGGYFQLNQFFLPLLIFTIPIFDTTTVFMHRLLRRQSPFVGGRDHLSHHLVYLGLSDKMAVFTLGFINLVFIVLGIWVFTTSKESMYIALFLWLATFVGLQIIYKMGEKRKPQEKQ